MGFIPGLKGLTSLPLSLSLSLSLSLETNEHIETVVYNCECPKYCVFYPEIIAGITY